MSKKKPLIKYGWLRAFIFFFAFAMTYDLSSKLRELLIRTLGLRLQGINFSLFNSFVRVILIVILVYLFTNIIDRRKFSSIGISIKNKWKDIGLSFLIGAVIMGLGFVVLFIFNQLNVDSMNLNSSSLILTFVFLFFASIIEEIALRGYILTNLMDSVNKYIALFVSSVVFGLVHITNPDATILGIVNLILMGVLLGLYYIHKRNLWFPVVLHLSWNFFQNPIFGFRVSGFDFGSLFSIKLGHSKLLTGGPFGFEGSIVLTVLVLLAILFVEKTFKTKQVYY